MKRSERIYETISGFPRLKLSVIPTVVYRMEALSSYLKGDIYVKRDDLTAFAFGGNKTRKLDYLVKHAIDKGCDCLVTFGAVQSNWCRMTSAAGTVNGLDVYLVLGGGEPYKPTANLLLDQLSGANIDIIESTDKDVIIDRCRQKISELEDAGRKPYYMAVGGSDAIGSLGYVNAFAEILAYNEESGTGFSKIVVASGSAGTQAGLVAGQIISGWEGDIVGMAVSRNSAEQSENVAAIVRDTLDLSGLEYSRDMVSERVIVDDNYLGEGYRELTCECTEAIEIFARKEGIFLDEVYTGKAAAGLIDYFRKGKIDENEKVLFIHTGGAVQLFE